MDRIYAACELKNCQGIPRPHHLEYINKVINGQGGSYLLGKVMLASRLSYFYALDPEWTRTQLLPKFNWHNAPEAKFMWDGYLVNPGISIDLAAEIKEELLLALRRTDQLFSNRPAQLYQLFGRICIEFPELYSMAEKQGALKSIGKNGLKHIAELILRDVGSNKEKDNFWRNRLKPFICIWPKDKKLRDPEISQFLALMSVQFNQSFPDVLNFIKNLIVPFDLSCFLNDLCHGNYTVIENYPMEVFDLLRHILPTENDTHAYQALDDARCLMNRLCNAGPGIKERKKFKEVSAICCRSCPGCN